MLVKTQTINMLLCSGAILGISLNPFLGGKAALLFLVFGMLFILFQPSHSIRSAKENWPLFLFPAWALVTMAWSVNPIGSLRSDIQLILTFGLSVAVVAAIQQRRFLTILSICYALTLSTVFAMQNTVVVFQTGEIVRVGLLGSKNNVSSVGTAAVTCAMMLLVQPRLHPLQKFLSLATLFLSVAAVLQAKSLGTLVAIMGCAGIGGYLWLVSTQVRDSQLRKLYLYSPLIIVAALFILLFLFWSYADYVSFMTSIGKDPTITGRTFIWSVGMRVIDQNFWTGVGLNGFWNAGNADAILLWEKGHRDIGAYYGFHNTYIHAAVEVGIPGLVIMLFVMGSLFGKAIRIALMGMRPYEAVAASYAVFLIVKSFFETYGLGIFSAETLFLCFIWRVLSRPDHTRTTAHPNKHLRDPFATRKYTDYNKTLFGSRSTRHSDQFYS